MRFRLSRTIPHTPWRAENTWSLSLQRFAILIFGLALFGIGDGLLVVAHIGNAPWSVLAQGLSLRTNIALGWWTFFISTIVLNLDSIARETGLWNYFQYCYHLDYWDLSY